jgi:hypothetical protein
MQFLFIKQMLHCCPINQISFFVSQIKNKPLFLILCKKKYLYLGIVSR